MIILPHIPRFKTTRPYCTLFTLPLHETKDPLNIFINSEKQIASFAANPITRATDRSQNESLIQQKQVKVPPSPRTQPTALSSAPQLALSSE
ncbi:hypothetical protein CEXT_208271 [Caerostris extrusa]|uniref:Uncharacterized protein n=1 Tax=Caerostris extrusa TaxID=172846 RepID=A0AAV4MDF6_CAEEX|nr:hypothetical protein CEXT_208271 [Caerostris extrusa]